MLLSRQQAKSVGRLRRLLAIVSDARLLKASEESSFAPVGITRLHALEGGSEIDLLALARLATSAAHSTSQVDARCSNGGALSASPAQGQRRQTDANLMRPQLATGNSFALAEQRRDASTRAQARRLARKQQSQAVSRRPNSPVAASNLAQAPAAAGHLRPGRDEEIAEREEAAIADPQLVAATPDEVARIVRHPALIVTRNVEWGTVILGFEQANKYTILDQEGNTVALLAEDSGSFGKEVGRQLLRTRRSFTATILSPDGRVLLRLRRPMYLVNSTIYVEDGEGVQLGEVRQRFHLWRRNYDIYLGRRQVATIASGLLAWEFALRDEDGGVLALIDRNFQGFGKEIFTDAGKYVIHFGDSPADAAAQAANTIQAAHPDKPRPHVTTLAKVRTEVAVIPTSTGDQLQVARPLRLDERLLALAAAVSIDFDYFSQHSHGTGLMPFMLPPIPYPSGGGAEGEAPPSEEGVPPADSSAAGSNPIPETPTAGQQEPGFGDDGWSTQEQGPNSDFDLDDDNAGWSPDGGGDGDGEGGASTLDFLRGIFGDDN